VSRLLTALVLVLRFLGQLVVAGIATARVILTGARGLDPAIVRMPYQDLDELGVTVLGCLISLTPGTTTIDIDTKRSELVLHLLDTAAKDATFATIHTHFELPLRRIFPVRPAP
jgi:multisubunit Na+/H+ antiporter MnhE subunit